MDRQDNGSRQKPKAVATILCGNQVKKLKFTRASRFVPDPIIIGL